MFIGAALGCVNRSCIGISLSSCFVYAWRGEKGIADGETTVFVRARRRAVMPENALENMFRGERGDVASRSRLGMSSGIGSGSGSYGGRPAVCSGTFTKGAAVYPQRGHAVPAPRAGV